MLLEEWWKAPAQNLEMRRGLLECQLLQQLGPGEEWPRTVVCLRVEQGNADNRDHRRWEEVWTPEEEEW
jgi:hypothetical protein